MPNNEVHTLQHGKLKTPKRVCREQIYSKVHSVYAFNSSRLMMESDSLWTVAFCVMAFFSVITNVMVLWTVFGHRRMQTNTNIFLVNIAIVDLLMAVLNAVPNFFHMRDRYILRSILYSVF